jgi:hypothetical protein
MRLWSETYSLPRDSKGDKVMMPSKLKAYMVHDGEESEKAALVFANNAQEARKIGYGYNDIGSEGFLTVTANRLNSADCLCKNITNACIEHDATVLRQAGFQCEGDERCARCGLAEIDGKYPVCPECCMCTECGHAEDCGTLNAAKEARDE